MTQTFESKPLGDLRPGDILHSMAGITFTAPRSSSHTIVTAEAAFGITTAQVHTSHTIYTVAPDTEVTFSRVDCGAALLIGRRTSMHAALLGFGTPVTRRAPVEDDETAVAVTATEWAAASMIFIDGFLAQQTIRAMWNRDEFTPEGKHIYMIGDDLDDARIFGRARASFASGLAFIPENTEAIRHLLLEVAVTHPVEF